MADEQPDVECLILDKKDFDEESILNDESFEEGVVYRLKSFSAKVYQKCVEYQETSVVGYLKPVDVLKYIGKISIKELFLNRGTGGGAPSAPPPRHRPPKQAVSFMAELGNVLQAGVQLKSVRRRSTKNHKLGKVLDGLMQDFE
jgi:hypothetical protein